MADITWSVFAAQNYTPEQLECAARGGVWDRLSQTCTFAQPLPPADPLMPPVASTGTIDPQQMFDDGFVYVAGKWVKADSAEARGVSSTSASSGGGAARPGSASVLQVISSGSVLGYDIPAAAPVALPSFVGGLLGTVRIGGGMRGESGGTPKRVVMGPAGAAGSTLLPQVRMGVNNWGR